MMQRIILVVICLLLAVLPRSGYEQQAVNYKKVYQQAQRLYTFPDATDATDSLALISYHHVISILEPLHSNDSVLFDSYVKAGIIEMTQDKPLAALQDFRNSLTLFQQIKTIPDSACFKSFLYIGSIHYSQFNFDSALHYYKRAEGLITKYPLLNESERLYNKLGVLFFETGDYKQSILYFGKALAKVEETRADDITFIVNYENNIASAYRKLRRYAEALQIYKKLLPLGVNTKELLHNIGITYLEAGNPKQSIFYLKKVPYQNIVKYNDLARAYLELRSFDSSHYYLQLAMRNAGASTNKSPDLGITMKRMGDWFLLQQQSAKALASYQQAIIRVDPDFEDTLVEKNPVQFYGLHNFFLLFDILTSKAEAFNKLFAQTNDLKNLENSLATFLSAFTLASEVQRTYHSDDAKLFLEENVSAAFKSAVSVSLQLYELTKKDQYLKKAFNLVEKAKASVLQSNLTEAELNGIIQLPENIATEQRELKTAILKINMQLLQSADSATGSQLRNELRDKEILLSALQDKIQENRDHRILGDITKEVSVDSLQRSLLKSTDGLLSYFYFDNRLICFYITQGSFGYKTTVMDKAFISSIATLRKQLNGEVVDRKAIDTLAPLLYQTLLGSVSDKIKDKDRLLIIPYNELSYIPFEMLARKPGEKPMVFKYAISYNYSVNFLSPESSAGNNYQTLAMAPFASNVVGNELPLLTHSAQEVEGLKGLILTAGQATKSRFLSSYRGFDVVHLATHAVINDSFPLQSYIAFSSNADKLSGRLYEQEIYNLDMQKAKLVILSACETGSGRLIYEEGVISLSRAFSYAGCKSVVTSLWRADDVATAFIVRSLHRYLKKGLSKDVALQRSKIDYLESNEIEARFKTPSYWSHLILIGNSEPVVRAFPYLLVSCCVLLFLLLVIVIIRSRLQKTANGPA